MSRGLLRSALVITATALLAPIPAVAGEDVRWIAYIAAGPDEFSGDLRVVRSDGTRDRLLLEGNVLSADAGPGGIVYAARELSVAEDAPSLGELVRVPVAGGEPEDAVPGAGEGSYLSVAAGAGGGFAYHRRVSQAQEIPSHLTKKAIRRLRKTELPVLSPPEEPPETGGVVANAETDFYRLLFTNDPKQERSHAEQVNVFVEATNQGNEGTLGSGMVNEAVDVRGEAGEFFCGASSCFVTWTEFDVTYTVGEFGDKDAAVEFADSLVPMEELAGPFWKTGEAIPSPELVVQSPDGERHELESVEEFCECGFTPVDWSAADERLLVITGSEGYTSLQEYEASGEGKPKMLTESTLHENKFIADAAYGPDGAWLLLRGGGPGGTIRSLDGTVRIKGAVSFDIAASTVAYVNRDRDVVVRNLATGDERTVASGAIDVSIAPDLIAQPASHAAPGDKKDPFPIGLVAAIAAGGLALLGGGFLLGRRRARRR